MEYQITSQPNWHTVVHFSVNAEKIKSELENRFSELQKKARLEGFRKGRVPANLVKKMFGKSIEAEIFQRYVSEAYDQFFKENEFSLLNSPEINDLKYDESTLQFDLHFDVRPEFVVAGFKDMPVEKENFIVTEADVESALQNLRERNAMVYNVDGEAKSGHYLVADLQELDRTGVPIVGNKYEQQTLWIKDDDVEIKPQLVGARAGDRRRIILKAEEKKDGNREIEPKDDKIFEVSVREVKERRLPELDDEFAKDLGPFQSLEDLRTDIEKRLKTQAEMESKFHFEQALADELIKRTNIEAPPSMIEVYLTALVKDVQKSRKQKANENELRQYYKTAAIRNVKWIIIRGLLVKQQNLEISDEELNSIIDSIAAQGEDGEKRVEKLRKDKKERERLRDELEDERVYAFLAKKADVKESSKPWRVEITKDEKESEE